MRYVILVCDYDGTLAREGIVQPRVVEALRRLRESGRRLVLVTGRQLDDLLQVFPEAELFDRIVAENGAVLFRPSTHDVQVLGPPPPDDFVTTLAGSGVAPLARGRVVIATCEPNQTAVLDVIRRAGLELQVVFNKGAVMILPSGVNKATGLEAALAHMGLSAHNAVGIGDAENDHAFLRVCECSVAVANALPSVKDGVDLVTTGDDGEGVIELIAQLLEDDLHAVSQRLQRHHILLGTDTHAGEVLLAPHGETVLLAGASGSGKSTLATGFLERLAERGYQFCIVDPEGDYEAFAGGVVLGDARHEPGIEEILDVLARADQNAVVNLLGVPLDSRPGFFARLLPRLQEQRARTGHPSWIVVDEAHHLLPASWNAAGLTLPQVMAGMMMITVHPEHVSPAALSSLTVVLAVGANAAGTVRAAGERAGMPSPAETDTLRLEAGEAFAWWTREGTTARFRIAPPREQHQRHRRKYAEGELAADRSFYFQGPEAKLNLRAQNLVVFLQMGEGVDDQTWLHHLRRGDYSRWFRDAIKDADLAAAAAVIEADASLSASESRARLRAAIGEHYTLPA